MFMLERKCRMKKILISLLVVYVGLAAVAQANVFGEFGEDGERSEELLKQLKDRENAAIRLGSIRLETVGGGDNSVESYLNVCKKALKSYNEKWNQDFKLFIDPQIYKEKIDLKLTNVSLHTALSVLMESLTNCGQYDVVDSRIYLKIVSTTGPRE